MVLLTEINKSKFLSNAAIDSKSLNKSISSILIISIFEICLNVSISFIVFPYCKLMKEN